MNNPHTEMPTGGISPFRDDRNYDKETNNLTTDISHYKTDRHDGRKKASSVMRSIQDRSSETNDVDQITNNTNIKVASITTETQRKQWATAKQDEVL